MAVAAGHQQTPLELASPTAGETTSAILAYLTLQGFAVGRQNTSGIYDQKTGRYRFNLRRPRHHRLPQARLPVYRRRSQSRPRPALLRAEVTSR